MSALLAALALQAVPDYKDLYAAGRRGLENLKVRTAEAKGKPDLAEWVLLALERSDLPENHPALRDLLADVLSRPPATTRSAALQAMALARLDPARYRPRIADAVQLVLDQQCADGLWGPGSAVESLGLQELPPPPKRPRFDFDRPKPVLPILRLEPRARGPEQGDVGNAAWAAEALRWAEAAKVRVPEEILDRAILPWRTPDRPPAEAAASLSCLLFLKQRDGLKDADVLRAAARLEQAPFPATPEGLYSLRTAMFALDRDRLGGREWFREGGDALKAAQVPDGSWGDLESTARAVLFIGVPLPPIRRPGSR